MAVVQRAIKDRVATTALPNAGHSLTVRLLVINMLPRS
jgi:hypothetical protein